MKHIALMICALAILAGGVQAKPAPEWLRQAEVYAINYANWNDDRYREVSSLPFVIMNHDRAAIDKLHKMGVRVICYVTFYQMPPNSKYQNANIAEHPEWPQITEDGKRMFSIFSKPEGEPDNNPGWLAVCRNSPGYWRSAVAYTKYLMKSGVDGIFIDNVINDTRECHGPKFGKHQHIYPDKNYVQVNTELFKVLRSEIKRFGNDKVLLLNTDTQRPEWADACDGQMLESYICTWAQKVRRHDAATLLSFSHDLSPITSKGCAILALSYPGYTKFSKREDAFYCYAWSRLSGFLWTDWFNGDRSSVTLLKLGLGKPLGAMKTGDGYYSRKFEKGLVVVTSENRGASISLSAKDYPSLYDAFEGRCLKPDALGSYLIKLEPGQGRVFL